MSQAASPTITGLLSEIAVMLGSAGPSPVVSFAVPCGDYPFAPNYIDICGGRLHYIDVRETTSAVSPIVLLHGNPTWSYLWRNIIPYLAPLARCIAPDLAGFGLSEKTGRYAFLDQVTYFEGLVQQLNLKNVTLVTHDWGTAVGFLYAMQHPENVKGIAFMEALLKPYASWEDFPRPEADPALANLFRSFRGGQGKEILVRNPDGFLDLLLRPAMGRPMTAVEVERYRQPFPDEGSRLPVWWCTNQLPVGGVPVDVDEVVAWYSQRLCESAHPKLLLYSRYGIIVNETDAAWCRENLKNVRTIDIDDRLESEASPVHFLQERFPIRLGEELAAWYRSLSACAQAA